MKTPPRRHVRVFRIRSGRWSYLITGSEEALPFQGFTTTWGSALRRGIAWRRVPEMRVPQPLGGTDSR